MTKSIVADLFFCNCLFILVFFHCFWGGNCDDDTTPEPSNAPEIDTSSSLSSTQNLILYAVAIVTFVLLGILFLYCALPSNRRINTPPYDPSTHHMPFEAADLRLATRECQEDNLISSTHWGCVFKGTLQDGFVVAIKRLNLNNSDEANKSFFEVSNALTDVGHRNLVRILGFAMGSDYKQLVMEYVDCQNLDQHMHNNSNLSREMRLKIAHGTARALVYIHEDYGGNRNGPIVHGNLKPSNIFVDMDNQEPLLSDYGIYSLIEKFCDSSSTFRGLNGYAAPECKRSEPVTQKSDVYSYGIVLLQLLTLKRPTSEDVSGDLPRWVRRNFGDRYEEIIDPHILTTASPSTKKKIKRVLGLALLYTRDDPHSRPLMKEVLDMLIQMMSFRFISNAVVPTASEFEEVYHEYVNIYIANQRNFIGNL